MIDFKIATEADVKILALLGRITYLESHSHFIKDKNDLHKFTNDSFSINKTKQELLNPSNLYYIIYVNELPVGFVKLALNEKFKETDSPKSCRLEKIYILSEFIPLKIGKQLLEFAEAKAKELKFDTFWLTVYIKNYRAIRFYEKNNFKPSGKMDYLVNSTKYKNIVFSKKI